MTITTAFSTYDTAPDAHREGGRAPLTRTRHDDVASVPAAIRSEWIKLTSIRSNPVILASSLLIGILLSWILATFVKTDMNTHEVFTVSQTFIFSTWLSTVLAAITGTLMFTSEVQHGTLATVVTAQPARWVTVGAKATIAAGFGLAMGVLAMIGGFTGAVVSGLRMGDTSGIATTALWGLMVASLAAVLGLGVGMIIRHSSAAVSTLLVWALVIENLIRSVAPATVSRFLPFSAADGLLGIKSAGDTAATAAVALTRVQDAIIYSAYTVLAVAIGSVLLYRRDAN